MLGINGSKVDWVNMPLPKMARGNALDSYFTIRCFELLWPKIEKMGMDKVYNHILRPATLIFRDMENDGLYISNTILNSLGSEIYIDLVTKENDLYSYSNIDKSLDINSRDDLTRILFSCDKEGTLLDSGYGLYPPIRTTKTGAPSTSAECLDILLDQIETEIECRKLNEEN